MRVGVGFALGHPLADSGVDGGMDNGLVEVDDERELASTDQSLGGLELDAAGLLVRDGGAGGIVGEAHGVGANIGPAARTHSAPLDGVQAWFSQRHVQADLLL